MKELFAGFLNVSLSGSLIICVILLLRLAFKKVPKALICLFWAVAILRLLLPFQIQAEWSLRPDTPTVSGEDSQLFVDTAPIPNGELPPFIPQRPVAYTPNVVVDYFAIATAVWGLGVCVMGLYTLISYLRLKNKLGGAVSYGDRAYKVNGLDTAFLLGFLHPRIYLPADIQPEEADMVIRHERAHLRRGDNWLKLIGFICLSVHWFNPLVWLAYILLCRDVEDACDEQVVRKLGVDERKAYSAALLSCAKKRNALAACPVAFGEEGIPKRIRNVLNYRKPAVWICVAAVIAIVFVSVFFMTDPIQSPPPYYEDLVDVIGKPIEEVCAALGVDQSVLGEEIPRGGYETSIEVEYQGVPFTLWLGFDPTMDNVLIEFGYLAVYEDNMQLAAEDTLSVARQLWKTYGKGYQWEEKENPKKLSYISLDEILTGFANENKRKYDKLYVLEDDWDLTGDSPVTVREFLERVKNSDVWEEAHGEMAEKMGKFPHFYLDFHAWHDPDTNISKIVLIYTTGLQPGHYRYYEEFD